MDSYASYTRQTSEPLKAIAHARRFRQAADIIDARPSDIVLDYGCADAHLFSVLGEVRQRVAYDPDPNMLAQIDPELRPHVLAYGDLDMLLQEMPGRFDVIACMEVCEHLTPFALDNLLGAIEKLCAPDARIIFGVPLETGLSGFAKGLYRSTKLDKNDATIGKSLRSLFGMPIERRVSDVEWHGSHVGFNHGSFADRLRQHGFAIRSTHCLPFAFLGPVLNNEIYFSCTRPQ